MSKERLEEMIGNLPYSIRHEGNVEALIEFAKEQAERVQELEEREKELININQHEMQYRAKLETRNVELEHQNKRYREALELLVKQETLGKDVKTGKTAISYNGMIALKGLGIFNDDEYIVYGVDEVIESVLEESE